MQDTATQHRRKICIAITKGYWGGAQQYVYTVATHMAQQYDVVVISGSGILLEKLQNAGIRTIEISAIQRDIHIMREIKGLWHLYRHIKKERPDVLHLNSSKMGFLGTIVGRLCAVPKIIFTAHGWAFNEDRSYLMRHVFMFLQYLTILLSHKTIAVSAKAKQDVVSLPYTQKKVVVIYNGISATYKLHTRTESRQLLGLPQDAYIIGTVSELHKNKGIDIALQAISQTKPEIYYCSIGGGEEKEALIAKRNLLGLEHRVFFLGRKENARAFIPAFDVFLLPSRTEAFPYVLLEAGVAGVPVVASRVGGIPEVIENYKTGLLYKRGGVRELVEAINTAYTNTTKMHDLGKALHTEVTHRFTEEKMLAETERLYLIPNQASRE